MLSSKKVPLEFQVNQKKFKKYHKIKIKNSLSSCSVQDRGALFCSSATTNLSIKQLVAVLKIVKPEMKISSKKSRLTLYTKVDTILTHKPKDIRMGRGKGVPIERVAFIQNGQPVFKLRGIKKIDAFSIYKKCIPKFSVKSKFIDNQW